MIHLMVGSSEGKDNVSSLDCQEKLNTIAVGTAPPTSCATEGRKVPPRKAAAAGKKFCALCSVKINGPVQALQHYESKKHRANVKRLAKQQKHTDPTDYQVEQSNSVVTHEGTAPSNDDDQPSADVSEVPKSSVDVSDISKSMTEQDANSEPTADGGDTMKTTAGQYAGVNGGNSSYGPSSLSSLRVEVTAMQVAKRILKASRKSSLNEKGKLVKTARRHLRESARAKSDVVMQKKEKQCRYFEIAQPENLAVVEEKKVNESRFFQVAKHRAAKYRVAHFNRALFNKYAKK